MHYTDQINARLERIELILGRLTTGVLKDGTDEGRARLYDAGMRATDEIREVLIAQEELTNENLDLYSSQG